MEISLIPANIYYDRIIVVKDRKGNGENGETGI
jgi:hypothetical protein